MTAHQTPTEPRIVVWFSAGAASAVAAKLTLAKCDPARVVVAYCETGAEHEDNERFLQDVVRWTNAPVTRLRNEKFADTWAVWEARKYISGIAGAPCTSELKVGPRLLFQRPDDVHVFGYTADASDAARADALRENWPDLIVEAPLIDKGLTKAACLAMLTRAGIKPPIVYALGLPNANCIPCCKATSPAYWALIRKEFPAEFDRMAALSRKYGARLTRVNGERVFIDEIPVGHHTTEPLAPECDFLCSLAEQDMGEAA